MGSNLTRAEFLKLCGGILSGAFVMPRLGNLTRGLKRSPFFPGDKDGARTGLLDLQVEAPEGTQAVRFYMDDIQVCELTDLYAKATKTKPAWKTLMNAGWFEPGQHRLRIIGDAPHGTVLIEDRKLMTGRLSNPDNQILLTGAWEFASQDELPAGAAEGEIPVAVGIGYNDGTWTTVMVPNSLGYVAKRWNKFEGILGVYRRTLEIDSIDSGEQFAIVLEACHWLGRVFVNGIQVGVTRGGRLPSRFNITNQIHPGNNLIAVVVDNRFSTMGPFDNPGGGYWNWCGLIQEVYIERTSGLALTNITAEGTGSGKLTLRADGVNTSSASGELETYISITDPEGSYVLRSRRVRFTVPRGGGSAKPLELQISHPAPWDLGHPNLYTVTLKEWWGGVEKQVKAGFRDVCASGQDILLNGKVVEDLQGFNRHSDYPGLGRTQPPGLARREIKELYDKGFRIFRPAHYPTTPAELDIADELGLLVIEQIEIVGLSGAELASKEIKDFAAEQLTKMIHRDRGHPSIIAWSVGNENRTDEQGAEEYIRDIIHLGKSLDSARLYTHVTDLGMDDRTYKYQDFVAHNFYAGWYDYDHHMNTNAVVPLLDSVQSFSGNKPIILSEYGAEAVIERPGTGMGTEFYQGYIVDQHNRLLNKRKHFLGKMYWTSTEFWCDPTWAGGNPDPVPPFHVKGLQGYYRDYNKLGWRVMFSPIRLSVDGPLLEQTKLGVSTKVAPGKNVKFGIEVTVHEVCGERPAGKLIIIAPDGFRVTPAHYAFRVLPYGQLRTELEFEGVLPKDVKQVAGQIRAVINEETEAQPVLVSIEVEK